MHLIVLFIMLMTTSAVAMDSKEDDIRYTELSSIRVEEPAVPMTEPSLPFEIICRTRRSDEERRKQQIEAEAQQLHRVARTRLRRAYSANDFDLLRDSDGANAVRAMSRFAVEKAWRDFDYHKSLPDAPDYIRMHISSARMMRLFWGVLAAAGAVTTAGQFYLLSTPHSSSAAPMSAFFSLATVNMSAQTALKHADIKRLKSDLEEAIYNKGYFEGQGGFEKDLKELSASIAADSAQPARMIPVTGPASMPRRKKVQAYIRLLHERASLLLNVEDSKANASRVFDGADRKS